MLPSGRQHYTHPGIRFPRPPGVINFHRWQDIEVPMITVATGQVEATYSPIKTPIARPRLQQRKQLQFRNSLEECRGTAV
jgi:hypothetical protein